MSGLEFLDRDGDLEGPRAICLTTVPACRASDRQTLKAEPEVPLAEETEDLGEKEALDAVRVQGADFVVFSVDMSLC